MKKCYISKTNSKAS